MLEDFPLKQNKMSLVKLSEEHGWIQNDNNNNNNNNIKIGNRVCVIPNHACPIANLTDEYVVVGLKQEDDHPQPKNTNDLITNGNERNDSVHTWKVIARGCVK